MKTHNTSTFVTVLALLGLAAGCTKSTPTAQDTAADEAQIRQVLGEIASTFDAGDYDGMFARYLDDVIVSSPGQPDIVGKPAWQQAMKSSLPPNVGMKLHFDTQELVVAGDLAYERGTYALQVSDKANGAELAKIGGRHIHIFKRQADGQWKGWRLFENSPDAAAPTGPPPN
ncbi:MAG: DUF4440 domain-containing protein [Pseudomonadota bacterium]